MKTETHTLAHPDNLAEIQKRIENTEAQRKLELENLRKEQTAIYERLHPFNILVTNRRVYMEKIDRARLQLNENLRISSAMRADLKVLIGNSDDGKFTQWLNVSYPHARNSLFFAEIIREWLSEAATTLDGMEKEILAMAKDRGLDGFLPDDLKIK